MENKPLIQVKDLSLVFGPEEKEALKMKAAGKSRAEIYEKTKSTVALYKANFDIQLGEIFVIIGLSGSGKSTLVRCLNGLNRPTAGQVLYNGQDISQFNREELRQFRREKMAMVFQHFGLMSHRDVLGNVEYGLEIKGLPKKERQEKAEAMLEMVGLGGHEYENITALSGGMKQRVGIARGLANDPEVLLMDEPFSALDPLVRKDMQFELLTIQQKLEQTLVFITHDINEAFKLGDRIAIMRDGEIIQIASPEDMSEHPENDYVQQFIDSADMTEVYSVGSVMVTPNSLVRLSDSPNIAIKAMKNNGVSSAYVVDRHMIFQGVVTIDDALKARQEKWDLADILITDVDTTEPDALLSDVMGQATAARFPIAVLGPDKNLEGIISKVHVLSTMV